MECGDSSAIRDEELMAYLGGEPVRPAVVRHIKKCQHCASQLATYRRIDRELTHKLFRWNCPSNHVLGEYHLGLLDGNQAHEVENHLKACASCMAEVSSLSGFLASDSLFVEDAPTVALPVAPTPKKRQFMPLPGYSWDGIREQAQAGVRRIVASLLPPQPQLAYLRDAAQSVAQWPRRYIAEDLNVSIQVEPDVHQRDALQVVGFVTKKGSSLEALQGAPVRLLLQDKVYSQVIDDLGNFVFPSVAPATYSLELQSPDGIVVIDQLSITLQD